METRVQRALAEEVSLINDSLIRARVEEFLGIIPEWMADKAAAGSPKNHPAQDHGPGGLMRHTKTVVRVLQVLLNSLPQYDEPGSRDHLITAAIIHDLAKYVNPDDKWTTHEHPLVVAEQFRSFCKLNNIGIFGEHVADLVETHMGRWVTNSHSSTVLRAPTTFEQITLHWADYIASQKFIHLFDAAEDVTS
jgi:hypothetical protein